ncbi:MAG: hypothetical protein MUC82_02610 [Cypionkella sp.]|jgi:hypothetical protein|nr:hypothetical protein [Cypionkella sp.]
MTAREIAPRLPVSEQISPEDATELAAAAVRSILRAERDGQDGDMAGMVRTIGSGGHLRCGGARRDVQTVVCHAGAMLSGVADHRPAPIDHIPGHEARPRVQRRWAQRVGPARSASFTEVDADGTTETGETAFAMIDAVPPPIAVPAPVADDGDRPCQVPVKRGKIGLAKIGHGGKPLPSFPPWRTHGTRPNAIAPLPKHRMPPGGYRRAAPRGLKWMAKPNAIAAAHP